VGLTGRDALRIDAPRAVGPLAGVVVYAAHAPLDWDWQVPAVTLVAIVLAGLLLAVAELPRQESGNRIRSIPMRRRTYSDDRLRLLDH
jgi:hypothetical protein